MKYILLLLWFVMLLFLALWLNGCASRQVILYVAPDPYQQSVDRQIALRQAEAQEKQITIQEKQVKILNDRLPIPNKN